VGPCTARRQSKKLKDLVDIARLMESHPHLWELLDADLKEIIHKQSLNEEKTPAPVSDRLPYFQTGRDGGIDNLQGRYSPQGLSR
jgi:hypothetical protein